jgi:hypothetical protein
MLKQLICAAVLAGSAAGASAQTHWDFVYTGFRHLETNTFDPSFQLTGSFDGVDADRDGVLQHTEVTGFTLNGLEYVDNPDGCRITGCSLLSFSYGTRTGSLDFSTVALYSDDFNQSVTTVVSDVHWYHAGENGSGETFTDTYVWTDQTTFGINPAPVPEPATYAMLGAGLLAAGIFRRRSR